MAAFMSAPDHLRDEQFGPTVKAYKLFRQNPKTGNLHPLFVDRNTPVPMHEWIPAQDLSDQARRAGLKPRPGWHAGTQPSAPHLMSNEGEMLHGRVWAEVSMPEHQSYEYPRPESQGGAWRLGQAIRVDRILQPHEYEQQQDYARQLKASRKAGRS